MAQYNVRDDTMYGLDRELAEKAAAKYDPKLEAEARAWIEGVLGESLGEGSFHEVLKSGIALVNLVRVLQPDIIKAPTKMSAPFKQMENIGNYLSACTKLGQHAHDSFQTVDLFEAKNMNAVIGQIHSLGRLAQKLPGYAGPTLGVKEATANRRSFTEAQLAEARNTTTFLGKGSAGTAAAGMSKIETGKQQVRTNVAGLEGLGTGGEIGLVGKGAHGTPGAQMNTAEHLGNNIVKTNLAAEGLGTGGEQTLVGGSGSVKMS